MSTTYLRIPKPEILTGPKHQTVDEATIAYLREAAQRVRDNRYWGSGVTALVAKLLDDAASAIETGELAAEQPQPTLNDVLRVVDGATDPCPAPGYAGRHTAVGAGAISQPYRCHGCGAWFTTNYTPSAGSES